MIHAQFNLQFISRLHQLIKKSPGVISRGIGLNFNDFMRIQVLIFYDDQLVYS